VAGFDSPSSGELLLNGERIEHLAPYERNVSTVFQNYALFPHLTARQNIEFGLRRRGARDLRGPVDDVLELLQLAGKESRYPSQMSGGEKQRVALARSLVLEPELLLLDEPLSALDPQLRKKVRVELKSLQRRVGITFLMVTHDQEEALSLSDQIAVMNKGKVEQVGTPQEIYHKPATRFVADFLGHVNWIDGAGVRPEATYIAMEPRNGTARSRPAVVRQAMFYGNCFHVEAELENGVTAISEVPPEEHRYTPGQQVHVWWHIDDEIRLP
jgi:spermidine/putrescine transport system ATP-binding protein